MVRRGGRARDPAGRRGGVRLVGGYEACTDAEVEQVLGEREKVAFRERKLRSEKGRSAQRENKMRIKTSSWSDHGQNPARLNPFGALHACLRRTAGRGRGEKSYNYFSECSEDLGGRALGTEARAREPEVQRLGGARAVQAGEADVWEEPDRALGHRRERALGDHPRAGVPGEPEPEAHRDPIEHCRRAAHDAVRRRGRFLPPSQRSLNMRISKYENL